MYLACFIAYAGYLAPGEVATVMVIAADRRQARVVMRYIAGFIDNIPMLAAMIEKRTQESLELNNRVTIEVHTCSFRAVRGYTVAAVICDEIAFWRSEESANPDSEVLTAIRPALASIPGSLLLCISSPYARRGALFDAYSRHYGKDGDPVLVWQADTCSMNPGVDPSIIEQAYAAFIIAICGTGCLHESKNMTQCLHPWRSAPPHVHATLRDGAGRSILPTAQAVARSGR